MFVYSLRAGTIKLVGVVCVALTVLITHAHADHVGGAAWFPAAYIHPADLRRGRQYLRPGWRMYFLYCHRHKRVTHAVRYTDALQGIYRPDLLPVREGDVFDLGGRTVETFETPGHSAGSVVFRDSKTGAVFAGDNVNPMVTLQYPCAVTVRQWIDGAKKTLRLAGDAPIYGGHGDGRIPRLCVETAVSMAEELVAGGERGGRIKTRRGKNKYPCIVYRANRIG